MSSGKCSGNTGKLFVASVSFQTDDMSLRSYFEKWGALSEAQVITDRETGRSRGFAFVTYEDPSSREACLADGPHELDGRMIEPRPAEQKSERSTGSSGARAGSAVTKKCFIGGLEPKHTKEGLEEYFAKFGPVAYCQIIVDRETNEPRGFGFVEFESSETAAEACKDRDHDIEGIIVNVKPANEKKQDGAGGGGGGGGMNQWGNGGGWQQGSSGGYARQAGAASANSWQQGGNWNSQQQPAAGQWQQSGNWGNGNWGNGTAAGGGPQRSAGHAQRSSGPYGGGYGSGQYSQGQGDYYGASKYGDDRY